MASNQHNKAYNTQTTSGGNPVSDKSPRRPSVEVSFINKDGTKTTVRNGKPRLRTSPSGEKSLEIAVPALDGITETVLAMADANVIHTTKNVGGYASAPSEPPKGPSMPTPTPDKPAIVAYACKVTPIWIKADGNGDKSARKTNEKEPDRIEGAKKSRTVLQGPEKKVEKTWTHKYSQEEKWHYSGNTDPTAGNNAN